MKLVEFISKNIYNDVDTDSKKFIQEDIKNFSY